MRIKLLILALLALTFLPALAVAGVPNAPLYWARSTFNDDSQAIEHVTICGQDSAGHDLFVRLYIANAGFKRGALTVAFGTEAPGGNFFASQTFSRSDYDVATDRLHLHAGGHKLEVENGHLVATFNFETLHATLDLTPEAGPLTVADRRGDFIVREVLAPIARIAVHIQEGDRTFDATYRGFAVHEASNVSAHRIYDRGIQVHQMGASTFVVVDYIDLPAERGGRTLGFLAISQKGRTFVGEVVKENRENERVDGEFDYQVPWQVTILAKRGEGRAVLRLTAERQTGKEDDLKDLGFLARKAVGALMHPVTYALKGQAVGEVQMKTTEPAQTLDPFAVRYKYAQAH